MRSQWQELMDEAHREMAMALGMTLEEVREYFQRMQACRDLVDECKQVQEPEYILTTGTDTETF